MGATSIEWTDLEAELAKVAKERDEARAALATAQAARNLAEVEAIGHAHAEGHLSSLIDEERAEFAKVLAALATVTAERDRLADVAKGLASSHTRERARAEAAEAERDRLRAEPLRMEADALMRANAEQRKELDALEHLQERTRQHNVAMQERLEKAEAERDRLASEVERLRAGEWDTWWHGWNRASCLGIAYLQPSDAGAKAVYEEFRRARASDGGK